MKFYLIFFSAALSSLAAAQGAAPAQEISIPLVIEKSVLPASDSHRFWDPPPPQRRCVFGGPGASLNFLSLAASAPATPDPKFGRLLGISRFFNLSRYISARRIMELASALELAKQAGQIIVDVRNSGADLEIEWKKGKIPTPVTRADYLANDLICGELVRLFPGSGILSQERSENPEVNRALERWRSAEYTWIIDPLDGTQNFIEGGNEFGVHIGLTRGGEPILGVNYYPAKGLAYFALQGEGAYLQRGDEAPVRFTVPQGEKEILPISNKNPLETRALYEKLFGMPISDEKEKELFVKIGSAGLRICAIAEGSRNLYISAGVRGAIWDFCSSQVILQEAGGFISDQQGNPIDYRSADGKLKNGAIVSGSEELYRKVLEITSKLFEVL